MYLPAQYARAYAAAAAPPTPAVSTQCVQPPSAPSYRTLPTMPSRRDPSLPGDWPGSSVGHDFDGSNPVRPHDTNGRRVEDPEFFTWKGPTVVHIDSADRDSVAYPNGASFRALFPQAFRGVLYVEVLNVNFPNTTDVPAGRYALLLNGLHDGTRFVPQSAANLGIFTCGESTNTTAGSASNTVATYALAKIPYGTTSTATFQFWRKSEQRQVKYFPPPGVNAMRTIDLTLADRTGAPLVFNPAQSDLSWSVTLEIACKN